LVVPVVVALVDTEQAPILLLLWEQITQLQLGAVARFLEPVHNQYLAI
jgi:hypothetical protein